MLGARSFAAKLGTARLLCRSLRPFTVSAAALDARLLDMPAMSPTMEEGGIVEWKVKPGQPFTTGDVLLDIETDKAEISVEAVDDGVLAKILLENGTQNVPVGKPIAVIADVDDDLSAIDYDALVNSKSAAEPPKEEPKAAEPEPQPAPPASEVSAPEPVHGFHGTAPLPAAERLIHENHLDVKDIKGTGPFGRITKGDVLAKLGKISAQYVAEETNRIHKLEKLDLSNVQVAPPKPAEAEAKEAAPAEAKQEEKPKPIVTSISIPLTAELAPRVTRAQREALRAALLSLKPKPSVLRSAALDFLTASSKPPFVIKSAKVQVYRGKPVSYDVVVEEPPAPKSNKAVDVFISELQAKLQ